MSKAPLYLEQRRFAQGEVARGAVNDAHVECPLVHTTSLSRASFGTLLNLETNTSQNCGGLVFKAVALNSRLESNKEEEDAPRATTLLRG